MAITPQRLARLKDVCASRMAGLRIVLDGLGDPGNRAAVIRSSEALGRAITTGSEKWVNIHYHTDGAECVAALRRDGISQILTAKPPEFENDGMPAHRISRPLRDIDFGATTALVFGHEKNGISPLMSKLCDGDFYIPMLGLTESFNVSVAAAICIHWGRLQRQQILGGDSDLSESERAALLLEYAHKNRRVR